MDQGAPPRKTRSFKEETKSQKRFQRQFSRQMSQDYHPSNIIERTAAVAAVALAIKRLEERGIPDQKEVREHPETFSITIESKEEEDKPSLAPEFGRVSKRFSGETSIKEPEGQDSEIQITAATTEKIPKKHIRPVPSIKKTPTLAEHLNSTVIIQPETAVPEPELPATIKPGMPPNEIQRKSSTIPVIPPTDPQEQSTTGSLMDETKADDWEKAEFDKIKNWYEKLESIIASWEEKRKAKAKRRLERTESEVARRRERTVKEYRNNIKYIDQSAEAAKVKAEERRRNEELRAIEKANRIRTTGKDPNTGVCC
ncbi:remorin 1.4-like isoform X2 [Juglans microcarpa x Juglans regia]|nr:remorin 1.4-like isoform X2 [Juglans microcarpa x Juglans regia]